MSDKGARARATTGVSSEKAKPLHKLKAYPLHKLTETKSNFKWTHECQTAKLQHLTSAPVLAYPDYEKPFILDTDASSLLSFPFTVRTDHGSLTNFKEPEGQMARWLERLQEFDFVIVHRPGKRHSNAARLPCCHEESSVIATISLATPVDIWLSWASKTARRKTKQMSFSDMDATYGCNSAYTMLVIPASKREEEAHAAHAGALSGHLGEEKTLARVAPGYHMSGARHVPTVQLIHTLLSRVGAVDILGPFPESNQGISAGYSSC